MLLYLETVVSRSTEPGRIPAVIVEKIGQDYYSPGTREQINEVHREAVRELGEEVKRVQFEVDATFKRLEDYAVDEYLDWYYSLAGEWLRLFKLVGGVERLEDYLAKKVRETFEQEKWYAGINVAFERLLSADEENTDGI